MQGQCHLHLATIYTTLQLAESAKTAHEVDTLIRTQILDAQNFVENQTGRDIYIEHADWVLIIIGSWLGKQTVPFTIEIHEKRMESGRLQDIQTKLLDCFINGNLLIAWDTLLIA